LCRSTRRLQRYPLLASSSTSARVTGAQHAAERIAQVSELGDFPSGSVTTVRRRCGKPNCHCAKPADTGHSPQAQLTQKRDGKTVTQTLSSPAAVRKAEKEIAVFRRFQALAHDLLEVNQKICRLRPIEGQEENGPKKNGDPAGSHPRSRASSAASSADAATRMG
jgi:hypothetical protein